MTKYLTAVAAVALLTVAGAANAQSQSGAATQSGSGMSAPSVAPKNPTATKGTTGSSTTQGSQYGGTPTNASNPAEQPPEGLRSDKPASPGAPAKAEPSN